MYFQLTTEGNDYLTLNPSLPPVLSLFRIGDGLGYVPGASDTDIHGNLLYNGVPSAPVVVENNLLKYTLYMDYSVGDFNFSEVGLYLPGNVLFALGVNSTSISKIKKTSLVQGNAFAIDCYVSTVGMLFQVYAELGNSDFAMSVPALASLDQLPRAVDARPNIYTTAAPDGQNSVVAVSNDTLWTVVGYQDQIHLGEVSSATAYSITTLDPAVAPGFSGELVVQFTSGLNTGVVRVVSSYDTLTQTYQFFTPFGSNPPVGTTFQVLKKSELTPFIANLLHGLDSGLTASMINELIANPASAMLRKDGTSPATGDLDIGGHRLTDVADPLLDTDAATKGFLNSVLATKQHSSLGGLQGGTAGEYYHLTQAAYTFLSGLLITGYPTATTSTSGDVLLASSTQTGTGSSSSLVTTPLGLVEALNNAGAANALQTAVSYVVYNVAKTVQFGSGNPSGATPTNPRLYFNTAVNPYQAWINNAGVWKKFVSQAVQFGAGAPDVGTPVEPSAYLDTSVSPYSLYVYNSAWTQVTYPSCQFSLGAPVLGTTPTSPAIYFNTSTTPYTLYVYSGAAWNKIVGPVVQFGAGAPVLGVTSTNPSLYFDTNDGISYIPYVYDGTGWHPLTQFFSGNDLTVSGNLSVNGNTTLGDSASDTVTIKAKSVALPNNLNFTSGNIGIGTNFPGQWGTTRAFSLDSSSVASSTAAYELLRNNVLKGGLRLDSDDSVRFGSSVGNTANVVISAGANDILSYNATTKYLTGNSLNFAISTNTRVSKPTGTVQVPAISTPTEATLQVSGSDASTLVFAHSIPTGTTSGASLILSSSRATPAQIAASTYAPVQTGDVLGGVRFGGDNSTAHSAISAYTEAVAEAVWSLSSTPTLLRTYVTAIGSSTPKKVWEQNSQYATISTTAAGPNTQGGLRFNVSGNSTSVANVLLKTDGSSTTYLSLSGDPAANGTRLELSDTATLACDVAATTLYLKSTSATANQQLSLVSDTGKTLRVSLGNSGYSSGIEAADTANVLTSSATDLQVGTTDTAKLSLVSGGVVAAASRAGKLLVSDHGTVFDGGINFRLQQHMTTAADASSVTGYWGTTATSAGSVNLFRSRGTAVGTRVRVQAGDHIGHIGFIGDTDGTSVYEGSTIRSEVRNYDSATDTFTTKVVIATTNSVDSVQVKEDTLVISNGGSTLKTGFTTEPVLATPVAGVLSIDASRSNVFFVTELTANVTTFTVYNWNPGQFITVRFQQPVGGWFTVAAGPYVAGLPPYAAGMTGYLQITYHEGLSTHQGYWTSLSGY
jgi:hypothetical protein